MKIIKIKLRISNAYLVKGTSKSILVDAGAPNEADTILSAIQEAGVNPKDLTLLLHTHGHVDHAGSTAELKRRLGIPAAVHSMDSFMLRTGSNGIVKPRNFEAQIIKAVIPKSFEMCEPDLLIHEELRLEEFGVAGKIIFTPGHTKGSISILFDNQDAIIGDLMMGGIMGGTFFGTRPNYHYFIDDQDELHASMKKIFGMKPSTLYVGHGGPLKGRDVVEHFSKLMDGRE